MHELSKTELSMMLLSERSLREFLEGEPDLYSMEDLKVRYLSTTPPYRKGLAGERYGSPH